jgi:hypothetical protein
MMPSSHQTRPLDRFLSYRHYYMVSYLLHMRTLPPLAKAPCLSSSYYLPSRFKLLIMMMPWL